MPGTLLFVVNDPSFFLTHRLPLAIAAKRLGYDVRVATGPGPESEEITRAGLAHYPLPLSRSGQNPAAEMRLLWKLYRLFRSVRPSIVHLVTIKPVLYGGLAARLAGIQAVVAAISGLGTVFLARGIRANLTRALVILLYRTALRHRNIRAIFQNPEDRAQFVGSAMIAAPNTVLIPGSGVDLAAYPQQAEPSGPPIVVMAARLLRDKGVFEFVEAARQVKARQPAVVFRLIGDIDPGNPSSLSPQDVDRIRLEGVVDLLGHRKDIAAQFSVAHIIVLPSYREGLPKVLIEAAACGRAVVTTDVPGCRDAIEPEITGLLVPPRNSELLAEAIEYLVVDSPRRKAMGMAGAALAQRKFDIAHIIDAHVGLYRELSFGR